MDIDLDLCSGIYPKGARHNGLLCGRKPDGEHDPLRIRRRYVGYRHTHNRRSRQRLNGTARGRGTFRLPMPLVACERRALDGVGLMRSHEVRRREAVAAEEETNSATARKQRAVFCRLRSVRYHCASEGAGLAGFIASTVTERSKDWCLLPNQTLTLKSISVTILRYASAALTQSFQLCRPNTIDTQ